MKYTTFNHEELLFQFRGDEEILLEMVELFIEAKEDFLSAIEDSIAKKDGDRLRISAHTLKGVLSNFFAENGKKNAYLLEECGGYSRSRKLQKFINL